MISSLAHRRSSFLKRNNFPFNLRTCSVSSRAQSDVNTRAKKMAENPDVLSKEELAEKKKLHGKEKSKVILGARKEYKKNQAQKLSQITDPKARFQQSAADFIYHKIEEYRNNQFVEYCERCWSIKRGCICGQLKTIETRHRYINWIHYKEIWRTTNTGTLLPHSCANARTLIFGSKEDDDEMERILKEQAQHTIFLYPSTESISIPDFLKRRSGREVVNEKEWDDLLQETPVLNVIGIDATWSLSRAMSCQIPPSIVRVHLTDPPKLSVSQMRNQSSEGRITTAEAFACAMRELGETPESVETLFENLKIRCASTQMLMGGGAKTQPIHSVENREIRRKANLERRAQRRAEREAHAKKRAEGLSVSSDPESPRSFASSDSE